MAGGELVLSHPPGLVASLEDDLQVVFCAVRSPPEALTVVVFACSLPRNGKGCLDRRTSKSEAGCSVVEGDGWK